MNSWLLDWKRDHERIITDVKQVTPSWLTMILKNNGYLQKGKVRSIRCDIWKSTLLSVVCRLTVSYSSDVFASSPTYLILKFSRPSNEIKRRAAPLRRKEVEFYTTVAPAMNNHLAPHCYDAVYKSSIGKAHLLLEDLSVTHTHAPNPLPPSKLHSEQNIACLAKLHAYWWEHPRLGNDIGHIHTEKCFQNRMASMEEHLPDFFDFMGDQLSKERRSIYENILSFYLTLQRLQQEKYLTLVHGDAHSWNFLNPYDPSVNEPQIIDWEYWRVEPGTNDVALMIAVNWYPERRKALETNLLKEYHEILQAYGVNNYSWDDCWKSYRLSVIYHLFTPIHQWVHEPQLAAWWHNLERCMLAFSDLNCAELLKV